MKGAADQQSALALVSNESHVPRRVPDDWLRTCSNDWIRVCSILSSTYMFADALRRGFWVLPRAAVVIHVTVIPRVLLV